MIIQSRFTNGDNRDNGNSDAMGRRRLKSSGFGQNTMGSCLCNCCWYRYFLLMLQRE